MNRRVAQLALVFSIAGAVSVGCGSEDDSATSPKGGAGGAAGSSGKSGSPGNGGSSGSGTKAGSSNEGGSAGEGEFAGGAGTDQGGATGSAGDHGDSAGSGQGGEGGGEGGEGGAGPASGYTAQQIERGKVLVNSMALCGGCHTASGGSLLGGNPAFANNLGAPNLTNDPSGIGGFSDARVIEAIRNGIALRKDSTDADRHLNQAMPYWLYHNLTDGDALAMVAFLRSLPPVVATVNASKPNAVPVTPFAPSSFPDSTLATTSPDYAAALQGKYLVSSVVACVRCHSPVASGLPAPDFFSGVPPTSPTAIFASNITPDATGIAGWTADDMVTVLKEGIDKAGETVCGSMANAVKGYAGMSDADARAIGVYLTTIPPVSKPAAAPGLEPDCP